jgi:hypothetical protein
VAQGLERDPSGRVRFEINTIHAVNARDNYTRLRGRQTRLPRAIVAVCSLLVVCLECSFVFQSRIYEKRRIQPRLTLVTLCYALF